jgi:tRNA A-37 threonylcarbamoyl transferase component Bud32
MTAPDQPELPAEPDAAQLHGYFNGRLDPASFATVDRWLATQSDDRIEELMQRFDETPLLDHPPHAARRPEAAGPFSPLRNGQRFQLCGHLGDGGMGIVDRIHDRALERDLAVKRCRPRDPDEHPDRYLARKQRFEQEVAILARLEHPGITPIYDVGNGSGGFPAYAMKCLDGRCLSDHRAVAAPSLAILADIVLRCAEAVAFAHSKGIVHRDIKPENLIVGTYGEVTLVDWGIAALLEERPQALAQGTPAWMAPEQATGAAPHPAMDIWALGALLLYCCDGAPPRPAASPSHEIAQPIDLTARIGQVPRGLRPLVAACLAHEPAARPPSVEALIADLRHWLSYGMVDHQQLGLPRRLLLWIRKHPRQSALVLSGLALVILAALLQWAHRQRHQAETRTAVGELVANVPLDDRSALELAFRQTQAWSQIYPNDEQIQAASERFAAARSLLMQQERLAAERHLLAAQEAHYHRSGRWPGDVDDRIAVLAQLGLPDLHAEHSERLVAAIRHHDLRTAITLNLMQAFIGARLNERFAIATTISSALLHQLLELLTRDDQPSAALLELLSTARLGPHEPELADYSIATRLPQLANSERHIDALLSTVAPDAKLAQIAQQRVQAEANAFWPNVFLARLALRDGESEQIRHHALIAHGHHPDCLWPTLLLAYASLLDARPDQGIAWITRALRANPANLEASVLEAAFFAQNGQSARAEALLQQPELAAHIRYHLRHPHGHPMELSCAAIVAAGILVPDGPATLGPITAGLAGSGH